MVLSAHYTVGLITFKLSGGRLAYAMNGVSSLFLSGVDLFFVLSGFLIGGILMDQRGSKSYFSAFYTRRACRILPVYILVVGSFVIIILLGLPKTVPQLGMWLFSSPMPIWSYLTFTQNIPMAFTPLRTGYFAGMTWSLAVEEQFYLSLSVLIFFLPRKAIPYAAVLALVAAPLFRYYAEMRWGWVAAYVLLPGRVDTLMAGVLIAYAVRQEKAVNAIRRHRMWFYALAVTFLIAALSLKSAHLPLPASMYFSLYAWGYALVIALAVCDHTGFIGRFFNLRLLTFCGLLSYGIYMYEQAINGLMHGFLLNRTPEILNWQDGLVSVISLILTFLLCLVSYKYLEQPVRNWGRHIKYRK